MTKKKLVFLILFISLIVFSCNNNESESGKETQNKLEGTYSNSSFGSFTFYGNGFATSSKTYGEGNNFTVYLYDNNRIACINMSNSNFFFKFRVSSDFSVLYQLNTDWSEPTSSIIWYKK